MKLLMKKRTAAKLTAVLLLLCLTLPVWGNTGEAERETSGTTALKSGEGEIRGGQIFENISGGKIDDTFNYIWTPKVESNPMPEGSKTDEDGKIFYKFHMTGNQEKDYPLFRIQFSTVGKYVYELKLDPNDPKNQPGTGYTCDQTVYTVEVWVTNGKDANDADILNVSYLLPKGTGEKWSELMFHHSYTTPNPPVNPDPEPEISITPEPEVSVTPAPEVSITPIPEVSVTPEPEVSITPIPEVSVTPEPEVSITPAPEVSVTPDPEVSVTPAPEVSVTPNPEVSVTPEPEVSITPAPEETITPTPESSETPSPTTPPSGGNSGDDGNGGNSGGGTPSDKGGSSSSTAVKTGDDTPIGTFFLLLLLAASVMGLLIYTGTRKQNKN